MYQRGKILQAFEKNGLTRSRKDKVKQFLQYLADNPTVCWKDVAQEFNSNYQDIQDDIIPIILDTNDSLIISNLLKYLDLKNSKQVENVKTYIQNTNAYQQPRLFMHMAKHYCSVLGEELNHKANLPDSIRTVVNIKMRKTVTIGTGPEKGKIETFIGKDRQYYFHLISDAGEILLVSEGYKTKAGCLNGVKSIKQNASANKNYRRKTSKNDQYYFVLLAANKKIIGTSKMYASDALCNKTIESVQKMTPEASVVSLDKQAY